MILVYSETRGKWLGSTDWVSTTMCAKSFATAEEAKAELVRRKDEMISLISLLSFVGREMYGLKTTIHTGSSTTLQKRPIT